MMHYIGIDDTDIVSSRGTGKLARQIATVLSEDHCVTGVTRHQLFVNLKIPFTRHNSCAVIHVSDNDASSIRLFNKSKELVLHDFIEGSDPGLVVAGYRQIDDEVIHFGLKAKNEVLTKSDARLLARRKRILLEGLGGSNDGIIGALAGVGLASTGNDGRFVLKGRNRELRGMVDVQLLLSSGINEIRTLNEVKILNGCVDTLSKPLRPALRRGKAVLYVTKNTDSGTYTVVTLN